ncbi:hypothetical protein IKQ21_06020, partial [bacterium]|nr:hypothetical protein [bacterium]
TKMLKPLDGLIKNVFTNDQVKKGLAAQLAGTAIGAILATIAAIPLMAWAAKTEITASRKGRFEAMDKELDNPNGFAVLTKEQTESAQKLAPSIKIKKPNKLKAGFQDSWNTVRDLVTDSKEYLEQRKAFLSELEERQNRLSEKMSPKEIEDAKRDQQLLTKIVEKIDIASQDYAENAELATQTAIIAIGATGSLLSLALYKILSALKIKAAGNASAITNITTVAFMLLSSIFAAKIQKQASRVGRYKIKQELLNNPDELIYVDDKKARQVKGEKVVKNKKNNIFKFLNEIWKDNQDFEKYKKNKGEEEKKLYKAIEKLNLSDEQIKEAETLQKNTFRTFNKIDENSQKYSESVEALGKTALTPIQVIFPAIASIVSPFVAFKNGYPKTTLGIANSYAKVLGIILLSTIPSILVNTYITKEQKKASRIADMMAINELSDYREFRA